MATVRIAKATVIQQGTVGNLIRADGFTIYCAPERATEAIQLLDKGWRVEAHLDHKGNVDGIAGV